MQNNISSLKPKRTIYSNFIFPTDNNDKRTINKSGDFKSASAACSQRNFTNELKERLVELEKSQDSSTQTSKTILQLAQIESGSISPDSLNTSPKLRTQILRNTDTQTSLDIPEVLDDYVSCKDGKVFELIDGRSSQPPPNSANTDVDSILVEDEVSPTSTVFYNANSNFTPIKYDHQACIPRRNIRERCSSPFVDTCHPNFVQDAAILSDEVEVDRNTNPSSIASSPRSSTRGRTTYMAPTISSENKNAQKEIKQLSRLFLTPKIDRSDSPTKSSKGGRNVPSVESSTTTRSYDAFMSRKKSLSPPKASSVRREASIDGSVDFFFNRDTMRRESEDTSSVYCENIMSIPLAKIKDPDWNTCIQGLAEIIDCCRMSDLEVIYPHMTIINQKLIELLRSPRSHVCRTACQAAGHLFEFVRDTRRPEFDEVVDLLLFKTADANKFIRQDANLALDCMVTHIPTAHSIRALCSKGPNHKNYLVRTATVRLVVCAVVIAGPESILNANSSEQTRKRIFYLLPKFVEDKNLEVRRFGERLYKILSKEFRFELYLKKYLDKEQILNMKKNIRNITFKS